MDKPHSVLHDLLSLAVELTHAHAAELMFVGPEDELQTIERIGTDEAIGGRWSTTIEPVVDHHPHAEGKGIADWVASILAVPVCGPNAEVGWLTLAHADANAFAQDFGPSLKRIARCIEHYFDRTLEGERLEEVGLNLRQHQHELRTTRDQLTVSNRELEQFAYIAAHELVAPLRAVAIYAEVLASTAEQNGDAGQTGEFAEQIRAGVNQMTEQVQHLLALSKNHHQIEELEPVDVTATVHAALDTLAEALEDSGANVTVKELPIVRAKAVPLQSVFANLITNAVRYRRSDRPLEIVIGSTSLGSKLRIRVADNGTGIDEVDQSRVFEMFERASSDVAGTGIGLALSRRILDVFGATIGVDENESGGATVWLEFPDPTVSNL